MTQSPPTPSGCVLLGIPNCDQIRKARRWLDERNVRYRFHDYRRDGIDATLLAPWMKAHGWEALINRQGTTWRNLPEAARPGDDAAALALMLAKPAIIKRPALAVDDTLLLGFDTSRWTHALGLAA